MSIEAEILLPRVAVLAGGTSPEREVSLASGAEVLAALRVAGYVCQEIDPAEFHLCDLPWEGFDVCFLALHGGAGEDGRVQQQLDELGIPYTGSGPEASRLAMSKSASKEAFLQADLPTPEHVILHADEAPDQLQQRLQPLGFPLILKPDAQGSSLGVSLVHHLDDLPAARSVAHRHGRFAVAERYLPGRELTVSVLGRETLPVLEITTPHRFFDYQAKYQDSSTSLRQPEDLPGKLLDQVTLLAVKACETLGTQGLARVDFRLDEAGQPWLLEVNTLPGLTERSLAPRAAALAGMRMLPLCEWMLQDALTRHPATAHLPFYKWVKEATRG